MRNMQRTAKLAAKMPEPFDLKPDSVYSVDLLRQALGLRTGSLPREIRAGRLKVHKRCGRYYVLGDDVLSWVRQGNCAQADPCARG